MNEPRVAVIAIHGVGDHQPFEMAKGVADLLEHLRDGPRQPRYCTFGEQTMRVNVEPVKVEGHAFQPSTQSSTPRTAPLNQKAPIAEAGSWGPMDAIYKSRVQVESPADPQPQSLDHLFMEGQLAQYKGGGPEDTYEVLRLEGKRYAKAPVGQEAAGAAKTNIPEKEVHIYDMFWSDLSGVATAGLRIFGELYQLLFHLGSVGANNVKAAATFFKQTTASPAWGRFDTAQMWNAAILAWPIPLLNLILLGFGGAFAGTAMLHKLSVTERLITATLGLLAIPTACWGYLLFRKGRFGTGSFRFPIILFVVLGAVVGILGAVNGSAWDRDPDNGTNPMLPKIAEWSEWAATAVLLLGAFAGIWAVVCAYDKRRPGSKKAFGFTMLAVGAGAAVSWFRFFPLPGDFGAMFFLLRMIEVAFWILSASWVLFWLAMSWAFVAGYLAVRATRAAQPEEAERANRTNWTARVTIALPALLFLLLTFTGWAGLMTFALPVAPRDSKRVQKLCRDAALECPNRNHTVCYTAMFPKPGIAKPAACWAEDSLGQAGIGYIPVLLLLTCVAAVIGIWALLPSVIDESSPPRGTGPDVEKQSESLGHWLDNGFQFMRWAGRLLYLGVFAFPIAMTVTLSYITPLGTDQATAFAKALGGIVAGAAVGLLGFGGRLSNLALGFRPIVRVALDVDNWLCEHPRDSNPTARICGRFVSLLRYVLQWKGDDGRGYDALIIFAHSQGTVITADLLRFLHVEKEEAGSYQSYDSSLGRLDQMPVYLFTMGCPLRQLYGLRFPYLYGYAPTGSGGEALPRPEDLGVKTWINAYRTGDYVGRYLWRPHPWKPVGAVSYSTWDPPQGMPANIWTQGTRIEFSIGPGAHTHYWDATAEPIAETLDVLIARAGS